MMIKRFPEKFSINIVDYSLGINSIIISIEFNRESSLNAIQLFKINCLEEKSFKLIINIFVYIIHTPTRVIFFK